MVLFLAAGEAADLCHSTISYTTPKVLVLSQLETYGIPYKVT